MKQPMERPTGAVEEENQKNEGDPSPLSPPQHGQESSAGKTSARLRVAEMIEEAVADAVERRFQSAKDKRWSELEKQYGSLSELAEKLDGAGGEMGASAEQAAEAEENKKLAEPDGDAPIDLSLSLAERVQALAKLPALKEDEDARAILLRHANPQGIEDYADLLEDLLRLGGGAEPVDSVTPSTPASIVIPGGADAPADLRRAYERRKRALRPGDINALTALKREFRQRGLDVF